MKVGTWPSGYYLIWGNKSIDKYNVGDRIKFKSTSKYDGDLMNWSNGIITKFSGNVPFVNRI